MSAPAVDQIWQRRGGVARYRIYSVRRAQFNALDEAEGFGQDGEPYTQIIAEPLRGGKPVGATLSAFQDRYEPTQQTPQHQPSKGSGGDRA